MSKFIFYKLYENLHWIQMCFLEECFSQWQCVRADRSSQCQSFPHEALSSVEAWTHKRCDPRVSVQGECCAGSSSSHHPLTARVRPSHQTQSCSPAGKVWGAEDTHSKPGQGADGCGPFRGGHVSPCQPGQGVSQNHRSTTSSV